MDQTLNVARIVSAFVTHNSVTADGLPLLIQSVATAIGQLDGKVPAQDPAQRAPAVDPRKSITKSGIGCLECGRQMKVLKRHLRAEHQLTPKQYREKWGLAADYPMVAAQFSSLRSNLAKQNKLGHRPVPEPVKRRRAPDEPAATDHGERRVGLSRS